MLVVESVCTEMHGIASSVQCERVSLPWSVSARGYALDTEYTSTCCCGVHRAVLCVTTVTHAHTAVYLI
eukprot:13943-Heterococcus_DN1.PRE.2